MAHEPAVQQTENRQPIRQALNIVCHNPGDLAGNYYALTGMDEKVRQQLVDDHFLFMSGDPNLKVAGMERDWPEGKSIRVSRWLEPNFQILCIWPFVLEGLRLRYYTLQNLIPSFPWITLGGRAAT